MESEWSWVGAAYTLTWVVLAAYAVIAHRRYRRAEAELRDSKLNRHITRENSS